MAIVQLTVDAFNQLDMPVVFVTELSYVEPNIVAIYYRAYLNSLS